MANSKVSSSRPLLLYSSADTESLFEILKELPIPLKFLRTSVDDVTCELYGYIKGRPRICGIHYTGDYSLRRERLIYLIHPWNLLSDSLRSTLTIRLKGNLRDVLLLQSMPEADNVSELQSMPCSVVTFTSTYIEAPEDRFRHCEVRRFVNSSFLFTETKSGGIFPSGHHLRVIAPNRASTVAQSSHEPQASALMDAYAALNNSIDMTYAGTWRDVHSKRVDLHLSPVGSAVLYYSEMYAEAQYSPVPLCFFTSHKKVIALTFMDSWVSLVWLTAALISAGSVITLYIHIRFRLLFGNRNSTLSSRLFLFFAATFLGKSPPYSMKDALVYQNVATCVWMLGMVVLGNYVQGSITATRTTPATARTIDSFPQLFRMIEGGAICPCINEDWRSYFLDSYDKASLVRTAMWLKTWLSCNTGVSLKDGLITCYQRTQRGTHVALSVCTGDEAKIAFMWDLLPGDHYQSMVQAPAIHIFNPLRTISNMDTMNDDSVAEILGQEPSSLYEFLVSPSDAAPPPGATTLSFPSGSLVGRRGKTVGGAVDNETGDLVWMESGSSGVQKQVPGQNGRDWSQDDKQDMHRWDERRLVQKDPSDSAMARNVPNLVTREADRLVIVCSPCGRIMER
ncbi:hypothetical protein HPB51_004002 [Rhipicephalus microplus]|uniref:Uncharacterized protein n=1 Tax=Rhipicephalus microplus TaxID=6941 RepID=A0A9J6DTG6_RHIMP|nr:hypothetical protein HPB51_004002 [Rhipicephalus microplus]